MAIPKYVCGVRLIKYTLSSLGISKNIVDKHINDILKRNENISLEELIKEVLKRS